ncbi:hypothetical protein EKK58_09505 [Candidatus Dependentiae bacterium]|nr:MAG: hypothetical protein EKK58_09505 [Candidatus Dependentiae bacterium]
MNYGDLISSGRRINDISDQYVILARGVEGSGFYLPYDYIEVSYPSDTEEVYTSRLGGLSGPIQEIITVTYTDNTKDNLSSVERQ